MEKIIVPIFLCILSLTACAKPNIHYLTIEAIQGEALVSIHKTVNKPTPRTGLVTGLTPLGQEFNFGKAGQLWFEIEKRGYKPHLGKAVPETGKLSVNLEKIKGPKGEYISDYSLPKINRLLLAPPEVKIIERGFSSEGISEEKAGIARDELIKGISSAFSDSIEVISVESTTADRKRLRSLWRDIRSACELLNPIRLKYSAVPPFLETKSSLKAAKKLGGKYGSEVMLFISGKQNLETSGMTMGIIGLKMTSQTLSKTSVGQFTNPDMYTPNVGGGLFLKMALIDCKTGEILWVSRGYWQQVINDLLISINQNQTL